MENTNVFYSTNQVIPVFYYTDYTDKQPTCYVITKISQQFWEELESKVYTNIKDLKPTPPNYSFILQCCDNIQDGSGIGDFKNNLQQCIIDNKITTSDPPSGSDPPSSGTGGSNWYL